jgi:hypothetical protein
VASLLLLQCFWQVFSKEGKMYKVKCTLVQALRLCRGCTAHRGSRDIALPFLDHGTRRGLGVSLTPPPLFTPGKDPVPILQEAMWAPGPVWTGVENLDHTAIRSPDRPARSQSLYRLSYPAHSVKKTSPKVAGYFFVCKIFQCYYWQLYIFTSLSRMSLCKYILRLLNGTIL